MALILLCSKRLATFWDTEKDQAMRHENSVFHGLLKHVPWDRFDRLVEDHGADAGVRRLSTRSQFVALLYGQFCGAVSLREIVSGLSSHAARLYHLGAEPARRSTLSDANAQRPVAEFTEVFAELVNNAPQPCARHLHNGHYPITGTRVHLKGQRSPWSA